MKNDDLDLFLRKQPSQERSKATVDAIIQATTRILSEEGYEGVTTRRLAELAGVAVGSLYQYFPSRDAFVVGALQCHLQRIRAAIRDLVKGQGSVSPSALMFEFSKKLVEIHAENPRLQKIFAQHLPRLVAAGMLRSVEDESNDVFREYQLKHNLTFPFDIQRAFFVLNKSCAAIISGAVLEHPEWLASGALAYDLHRLIMGYLGIPIEGIPNDEAAIDSEPVTV